MCDLFIVHPLSGRSIQLPSLIAAALFLSHICTRTQRDHLKEKYSRLCIDGGCRARNIYHQDSRLLGITVVNIKCLTVLIHTSHTAVVLLCLLHVGSKFRVLTFKNKVMLLVSAVTNAVRRKVAGT